MGETPKVLQNKCPPVTLLSYYIALRRALYIAKTKEVKQAKKIARYAQRLFYP
jgi:hypothetical protein